MAQALYDLIEKLTVDGPNGKKLRRQFHDSPESVTKDLTPEAKKALYGMDQTDTGDICKHVDQEFIAENRGDEYDEWEKWFTKWKFPKEEFVPEKHLPKDCQYEGQAYPDPKPYVYEIEPRDVFVGANPDGTVDVQVIGQGFVSGRTRLVLEKKGTNTTLDLVPLYSGVEGSFRCGHLWVKVTLPNPPPTQAEEYEIQVITTTGTDANGNRVEMAKLPVRKDGNPPQTIVFTLKP